MAINKVIYGEQTLIDLSGDTVTSAEHILNGYIGHLANGAQVTGTGGSSSSGIKTGKYTASSTYSSTGNRLIVSASNIGFTPSKFFLFKNSRTLTRYHTHFAAFLDIGDGYMRVYSRINDASSGTWTIGGNNTSWTTQTNGYLYFNGGNIYYRTTSSYILGAGEYTWVAIQ